MMKVGIFGGTFDPVTPAHKAIVLEALKTLDCVYIIPTTVNYYRKGKEPMFSFDERVHFCRNIFADISCVYIYDLEKDKDENWRTIDTIKEMMRGISAEFYLIIGTDSYNEFHTWSQYEEILKLCKLMVVDGRNGEKADDRYPHETITIPVEFANMSASKIREELRARQKI